MADSNVFKWPNASPQPGQTNETVKGTLTLDGSGTTFTVTHNLGFSTGELAFGYPEVVIEPAAAANHASDIYISSKTANTVVFTYLAAAMVVNYTIKRVNSAVA